MIVGRVCCVYARLVSGLFFISRWPDSHYAHSRGFVMSEHAVNAISRADTRLAQQCRPEIALSNCFLNA